MFASDFGKEFKFLLNPRLLPIDVLIFPFQNYMLGILSPNCAIAPGIPPSVGDSTCI